MALEAQQLRSSFLIFRDLIVRNEAVFLNRYGPAQAKIIAADVTAIVVETSMNLDSWTPFDITLKIDGGSSKW